MPHKETPQETAAWQTVAETLLAMLRLLENPGRPNDLQGFAQRYAALSRDYLAAIEAGGQTSVRAEAVVKALDLKTAKSKLEAFVERGL